MHTLPLDDDEYDTLDQLLAALGPRAMDVAMLEGYLTAIVIAPGEPAPERWLPAVWGDGGHGDDAAAALALRHRDYMRVWMRKDPGSFEPIFACGGTWTADAWRAGFVAGMELDPPAWAPLRATEPALLAPFQPGSDPARVAPAVVRINAFFHAPAVKAAKVGRNDPCPCGSGKKAKKCCG